MSHVSQTYDFAKPDAAYAQLARDLTALLSGETDLIANAANTQGADDETLEAVRHAIGADSLGYISLQGMVSATEQPTTRLCCACFDGNYPIELPRESALGKNVVEHMLANAARTGAARSTAN